MSRYRRYQALLGVIVLCIIVSSIGGWFAIHDKSTAGAIVTIVVGHSGAWCAAIGWWRLHVTPVEAPRPGAS